MFDQLHKNKGDLVLTKQYKTFCNALRQNLKQAKLDYYHHYIGKEMAASFSSFFIACFSVRVAGAVARE